MDGNNWRPNQPVGQNLNDPSDWRAKLQPASRQKIVNRIFETLERQLPNTESEGIKNLRIIVAKFEEKIYATAKNQSEYLGKISMKMLSMDKFYRNSYNSLPSDSSVNTNQSGPSLIQQAHLQQQPNMRPASQQTSLVMQCGSMESSQLPPQAMLQHPFQPVVRQQHQLQQTDAIHQHQTSMRQQNVIPSQQQWLVSQQASGVALRQNQLIGQPHSSLNQQNSIRSLHQRQVMAHQNNLSSMQQQQLGSQSNASGYPLQQRQELLEQSGSFSVPGNQQSVQTPQEKQQSEPTSLEFQGQQSQQQKVPQSEMMMQLVQSQQPVQSQHESSLQRPINPSLQLHAIADQEDPLYQPQRQLQEDLTRSVVSTTKIGDAGGCNSQEVYQKLERWKKMYLPELTELHGVFAAKLEKHDSLPQQLRSEQLEKNRMRKVLLERLIRFISVPRSDFSPAYIEKLSTYEKHLMNFLKIVRSMRLIQEQAQQRAPPPSPRVHQQSLTPQVLKVPSASIQQKAVPASQLLQPDKHSVHSPSSMLHQQHRNLQQEEQEHMIHNQKLRSLQLHQQLLQEKQRQQKSQNQTKQQTKMPTNDKNDMRMKRGQHEHSGLLQQRPLLSQPLNSTTQQLPISSLQPSQSAISPSAASSPILPLAPSVVPYDPDRPIYVASSLSNAQNIGHPEITRVEVAPDVNTQATGPAQVVVKEQPIYRLVKAIESISSKSLASSLSDLYHAVNSMDEIEELSPGEGYNASVGGDLMTIRRCRKRKGNFSSTWDRICDSFKRFSNPESDMYSAKSTLKRPRLEPKEALLKEIKEINQRLMNTVVRISDDTAYPSSIASTKGPEGTLVKCYFSGGALCPSLKSLFASGKLPQIQPLRLLVPVKYPNCSPVFLDKLPVEVVKNKEDLSARAKSRFQRCLRKFPESVSLKDIAMTWDECVHVVVSEYVQQWGGGTFTSKYGSWKDFSTPA